MATSKRTNKHSEPEYVSMLTSEFISGGGVSDGEHNITSAQWTTWDYQGKADPTLALLVTYDESHDQYYSAGKDATVAFEPTEDGGRLTKTGRKDMRTISSNSNAGLFLISLVNASYDEDKLNEEPITELAGLRVMIENVVQPKRSGMQRGSGDDAKEKTIALVTEILEEEKPKSKSKPTPTSKPNGKVAAKQAEDDEEKEDEEDEGKDGEDSGKEESIEDKATRYVAAALKKYGKLKKGNDNGKGLNTRVFDMMNEDGEEGKSQVINMLFREQFLKSGPWTYEKGVLSA